MLLYGMLPKVWDVPKELEAHGKSQCVDPKSSPTSHVQDPCPLCTQKENMISSFEKDVTKGHEPRGVCV